MFKKYFPFAKNNKGDQKSIPSANKQQQKQDETNPDSEQEDEEDDQNCILINRPITFREPFSDELQTALNARANDNVNRASTTLATRSTDQTSNTNPETQNIASHTSNSASGGTNHVPSPVLPNSTSQALNNGPNTQLESANSNLSPQATSSHAFSAGDLEDTIARNLRLNPRRNKGVPGPEKLTYPHGHVTANLPKRK